MSDSPLLTEELQVVEKESRDTSSVNLLKLEHSLIGEEACSSVGGLWRPNMGVSWGELDLDPRPPVDAVSAEHKRLK